MLRNFLETALSRWALRTGQGAGAWRRFGSPSIVEWGEYLRRHGGFYSFGHGCWINPAAYFADPPLTSVGNNVHIAGGFFTCHDGSVNAINLALGTKLDAVGSIRIHDDVFIGIGSIVLPNVEIGPRAIVGAGSVVSRSVPANTVAAGSPARVLCTFDEYVAKLRARNETFPWRDIIGKRVGEFDPVIEPKLVQMRQHFFFRD